jgi:asparagine synthase (glutamine-hydrolysing)
MAATIRAPLFYGITRGRGRIGEMCGIAGVLAGPRGRPADAGELRRMAAMLRHRGPDGWGFYRDDRIGLAHTRLAIVGLADGHQPLTNEDRSLWISGNGEIFNHLELRGELEARGHRFRTRCDIEAILHAYEEWGEVAWSRLNGQYAFALWDNWQRRLHLVRDPLGILPLHWAQADGAVLFASEAKALFSGGRLTPRFDPAGLAQVFTRWSTTAPATVFAGVRSVPPGAALCVTADLAIRETRHWRPNIVPGAAWADKTAHQVAGKLGEALERAVRLRLRADVPVGCYVSGGLDSSVITALASRIQHQRLDSFAVRFPEGPFDETPQQRLVAGLYGTRHHEIFCDGAMIADALAEVVWHCETPLLRTGPVPLFLLSGLVRQAGRKVVLTGEGADEFLAGYHIFAEDGIRRFWARRPDSAMRPRLLDRLHRYVAGERRNPDAWRSFFASGLSQVDHPFYSHLIRWHNTAWTARFLAPDIRAALRPEAMMAELESSLPADWRRWEPLARAQLIEVVTFLSGYLLSCQGDRVAMAHGVEVRYPFLDPEVVALCNALPGRAKRLGLRDKLALRRFAATLLPPEIAGRPKHPYRAPVAPPLFRTGAPAWIADALSPSALAGLGLADPEPSRLLVDKAVRLKGAMGGEREEMALVGLLTLQLLARQFGDEFAGRAARARQALETVVPTVAVEFVKEP